MEFPKIDMNILDMILISIDDFWHDNLNDFPLNYLEWHWLAKLRLSLCNYIERENLK